MKYWTKSWNVVTGCTPVSTGCQRCWARAMAAARPQVSAGYGFEPTFHGDRLEIPKSWHPERWRDVPYRLLHKPLVAVCWMGDLFHEAITHEQIMMVFEVLATGCDVGAAYMLLTKRPERMLSVLQSEGLSGHDFDHVYLGTSIEDQAALDARGPAIQQLATECWSTWMSVEPLLGPVDLEPYVEALDFVVIGPETGPGARPCRREWVTDLVRQVMSGPDFLIKRAVA